MTNVPTGAAISLALIEKIIGKKLTAKQRSNANSVIVALNDYGDGFGLQPYRLVQYLPQVLHEIVQLRPGGMGIDAGAEEV
jgi:putative chitinase